MRELSFTNLKRMLGQPLDFGELQQWMELCVTVATQARSENDLQMNKKGEV